MEKYDIHNLPANLDGPLLEKWMFLISLLKEMNEVSIAYSGGVDSSLLCFAAYQALGRKMTAYTIQSPVDPPGESEQAEAFAKAIGFSHVVYPYNDLLDEEFVSNTSQRCYFCKKKRFEYISSQISKRSESFFLEGTNLDDKGDYRPGSQAVKELGVRSPLAEAALGKDEIRKLARTFQLPIWDKPSNPCLATRFPYHTRITMDGLKRIGSAEKYLRSIGFEPVRVRYYGDLAKIELSEEQFLTFFNSKGEIFQKLKTLGFKFISLDLEGFQSGRMNRMLT